MKVEFDKEKNKICCRNCTSCVVEMGYCTKKKAAVAQNKKRYCAMYDFDAEKLIAREISASRAKRRSQPQPQLRGESKYLTPEVMTPQVVMPSSHPLTGDLSRFVSSGSAE